VRTDPLPLVVGIPSTSLSDAELAVLQRIRPAGVILFGRNIETADQVRALVRQLEVLDPQPFVAVDLEGGAVNRLSGVWGDLPSPAAAAAAGRKAVRALGEAAGAACRRLGIHLDLAPVVDLDRSDTAMSRDGRCLADDPERVATLALVFNDGLAEWGVSGCLKHYPGLGPVIQDTHLELPVLGDDEPLGPHLEVFERLSKDIPVVMVAHVVAPALGDPDRPATLSRAVVDRAASLPGSPIVLSDDLEMGALADCGDLPDLVVDAFRAHNHGALVCKAFDRLDEIAQHLEATGTTDPTFESRVHELAARLGTLQRDLCLKAAAIPAPDDTTVAQLWDEARRLAEPQGS
jgi:beta-N-acetylhexosaminidase